MGVLLDEIRAATERARRDGSLVPLRSTVSEVRAQELVFQLRTITAFEHKTRGSREEDPFRPPWTDALFVREWGPDHALLLNKFPVLDDHVLLVTREWEEQELPPSDGDLRALEALVAEVDGLAIYNGGRASGASQPHRHLQLIARESLGPIPLEPPILEAVLAGRDQVSRFRFPHRVGVGLPDAAGVVDALVACGRPRDAPGPHSLVAGRGWWLAVPRRAAKVAGMPVNSLGFAGFLATRDPSGATWLAEHGPWAVLEGAADPLPEVTG